LARKHKLGASVPLKALSAIIVLLVAFIIFLMALSVIWYLALAWNRFL
jgi:hypothetical protein